MKFKLFILASAFITAFGLQSGADIIFPVQNQQERFILLLDRIETQIRSIQTLASQDQMIDQLDYSGIRENFTQLQNLTRLYKGKKEYKTLEPFYDGAKEFEDHISHTRDLVYFYSIAQNTGNPANIQKYEVLLKNEKDSYKSFLSTQGWLTTDQMPSQKMRQVLQEIKWPDLTADRNFLLERIAKKMDDIHVKEYDMSQMEDGVHELKRDSRRLDYMSNSASYLVQGGYDLNCPIGQPVVAITPVNPSEYTCKVSQCLMDKLRNAQYSLDSIKTQGQQYEIEGNPIPESLIEQGKAVLVDLKGSNVFLHLKEQILGCRTPVAEIQ